MPRALETPSAPSADTCFPCPTGPGSGNGGRWSLPWAVPTSLCPDKAPSPWPPGRGGRGEGADKGSQWGSAWGSCDPLPDLPERPHPLLPLGRSAGAPGTVAMVAALGKLQLGNYCEHLSCLLPARGSRGARSQGQGSPSSPAGWPHPGLARRHRRYAGEGGRGGRGCRQRGRQTAAGSSGGPAGWP